MKLQQAHIGLTDPKNPENVGAVMRAAGCYNADSVSYTGERYNRAKQRAKTLHTDTKNVVSRIPLTHIFSFEQSLPQGAIPVAIEFVEGATSLVDFIHPDHAFYIFGPEDKSMTKSVVNWCQHVIYIPTVGCMNLAATVNVVLYDRLAKLGANEQGDQFIKKSRDTNNRLNLI